MDNTFGIMVDYLCLRSSPPPDHNSSRKSITDSQTAVKFDQAVSGAARGRDGRKWSITSRPVGRRPDDTGTTRYTPENPSLTPVGAVRVRGSEPRALATARSRPNIKPIPSRPLPSREMARARVTKTRPYRLPDRTWEGATTQWRRPCAGEGPSLALRVRLSGRSRART